MLRTIKTNAFVASLEDERFRLESEKLWRLLMDGRAEENDVSTAFVRKPTSENDCF